MIINKYIKLLFKNVISLSTLMFILPTIAFANRFSSAAVPIGSVIEISGMKFVKIDEMGGFMATDVCEAISLGSTLQIAPYDLSSNNRSGAISSCSSFRLCGRSDWRLPTSIEVNNIIRPNAKEIPNLSNENYWLNANRQTVQPQINGHTNCRSAYTSKNCGAQTCMSDATCESRKLSSSDGPCRLFKVGAGCIVQPAVYAWHGWSVAANVTTSWESTIWGVRCVRNK